MKVTIVGAGIVGVEIAGFLLNIGQCSELVLIDLNKDRSKAEEMDFNHMSALTFAKNTKIISGDYEDAKDSDIVVITAGAQIAVGADRQSIAEINVKICVEIAKQLEKYAPDAILINVTNPCDIVAHFITCNTSYPRHRVISSGCVVDSARLMRLVADEVKLDPKNIFGFILGEHGANSVLPWSLMNIAGQKVEDYCKNNGFDPIDPVEMLDKVKKEGLKVFGLKLNTNHGIAASVFRIIRAISVNENSVLPVGVSLNGEYGIDNIAMSVPCVINSKGVGMIPKYTFTEKELYDLRNTAKNLREVAEQVSNITGYNIDLNN